MKQKESEKRLERVLRDEIRRLGGLAIKIWSVSFTGLPDRIVLLAGKVFWVELKSTDGRLSPRQKLVHEKLRALGFEVWVIGSKDTLNEFLNQCKL